MSEIPPDTLYLLAGRVVSSLCRMVRGSVARTTRFAALAITLAGHISSMSPPPNPSAEESELKAVFVLNFIRLVTWAEVPGENNSELPVCALSKSDFGDNVRRVVRGKTAGNRSISFRLKPNPDTTRCRVLILDAADYAAARPVLNAVKNTPVLTIGNGAGLIALGGMFELIVQDRKVQFDASQEAVRRAGLDVSGRLLQLSRNLRKGTNGAF